jgi:uncharacterized protein YkwD
MIHRTAIVLVLCSAALVLSACGGSGDPVPVPGALITHGDAAITAGEQEMIDRHNTTRAGQGLGALTSNGQLNQIAQNQANYMADIGQYQHQDAGGGTVSDRATAVGYAWVTIGENVGYDTQAQVLFDGWMNSTGHRDNILDPAYNEIGVGQATRGLYQYWCVTFGAR